MSYSTCSQFRANFWRPSICAYCYRPKGKHKNQPAAKDNASTLSRIDMQDRRAATKNNRKGRTLTLHHFSKSSATRQNSDDVNRSATFGSSPPTRERKQKSEPPPEERQVGVVKPYAIVELNESWAKKNKAKFSVLKQPPVYKRSESVGGIFSDRHLIRSPSPPSLYPRVASAGLLLPERPGSSLAAIGRKNIIPKRKAPPPPPQDKERDYRPKRSNSVPPSVMSSTNLTRALSSQQSVDFHDTNDDHPKWNTRERALTASSRQFCIDQISNSFYATQSNSHWCDKELSPPRKPPRTQSTFVTDYSDGDDDYQGVQSTPEGGMSPANDYEPLRRVPYIYAAEKKQNDGYLAHQPLSLLQRMVETLDNGLRSIAETQLKELVQSEQLWNLQWSDITVCTQEDRSHQFYYHLRPISVEALLDTFLTEVRISKALGPHLNLHLIQGCLPEAPVDVLDIVPPAIQYAVKDDPPSNALLSELLPLWQADLSDEEYEQCVLMTVLQVFRALKDLYNNGIVHRDLGLDSLCVQSHHGNTIIKIANFQYALYRPGPLSATSFIYAFHELKWLGGADSKLPPEIMDTPNNVQTLDYARSDCFAAGCLIYELLLGENPFEKDSNLVYLHYKEADLPTRAGHSTTTTYLIRLAQLLLRRDPTNRISISDALLVLQTIQWLPHSWLENVADMEEVRERLSLMKASLMSQLASRTGGNGCPPLELLLRAEFLSTCSPTELMRILAVFRQ